MSQFLPVQQRPSWNSPIQILVSSPRNEKNAQDTATFPVINVLSSKGIHIKFKSYTSKKMVVGFLIMTGFRYFFTESEISCN